jgi:hypothetical protein
MSNEEMHRMIRLLRRHLGLTSDSNGRGKLASIENERVGDGEADLLCSADGGKPDDESGVTTMPTLIYRQAYGTRVRSLPQDG